MFWNSALSSVKIVPRNVSIAGPAGTQLSEHGEPGVEQGATVARATLTDGSWKLLDIAPEKEAREKTTAKTSISLTIEIVLKYFEAQVTPPFVLKTYPLQINYLFVFFLIGLNYFLRLARNALICQSCCWSGL